MKKDESNETQTSGGEVGAETAAPAESDAHIEAQPQLPENPKRRIAVFFTSYGGVIGAVCALLLLAVMVLLAVLMGGDLYDKAAFFWIIAFLAELGFYLLAKKSKGTLIAMIVTGALAAAFVALYGLELGGILP